MTGPALHTIMIIDDDRDDVELFCEMVYETNPDMQCLSALNGQEALRNFCWYPAIAWQPVVSIQVFHSRGIAFDNNKLIGLSLHDLSELLLY